MWDKETDSLYYPQYTIVSHSRRGRRAVVGREVLVSSGGGERRDPVQLASSVGWVVFQGAIGSSSQSCIHVPRSGGLVITIEEAINKDVGVDYRIGAWF